MEVNTAVLPPSSSPSPTIPHSSEESFTSCLMLSPDSSLGLIGEGRGGENGKVVTWAGVWTESFVLH